MKTLAKYCAAALMMGGSALVTAQPANAHVDVSVGIGGPAYYGGYGGYYGGYDDGYYDYYRPCRWYYYYDLPAPARCYNDYYGYYGPSIYLDSGFIFRDRDDWWRWHDRDDFRHWRAHDFHWHGDHSWGHGDWGHGGDHWGHNWGGGGHWDHHH